MSEYDGHICHYVLCHRHGGIIREGEPTTTRDGWYYHLACWKAEQQAKRNAERLRERMDRKYAR